MHLEVPSSIDAAVASGGDGDDPRDSTLSGLRWSADGYVTVLRAERTEVVRAEPFEAVELALGTLFGDDPPAP